MHAALAPVVATAPAAPPSRPCRCVHCNRPFVGVTRSEADAQAAALLESVRVPGQGELRAVYRLRQHRAFVLAFVAEAAASGQCPSCSAQLYEQTREAMATRTRRIAHA